MQESNWTLLYAFTSRTRNCPFQSLCSWSIERGKPIAAAFRAGASCYVTKPGLSSISFWQFMR
jgi:hypothetical protein